MDEFEKIKTFSEGLAERQQNVNNQPETQNTPDIDFPQYLSTFRAVPAQEEKKSKNLLWIVLGLCTTIAFATAFVLFPRLSHQEEEEAVVIAPTPIPVKVLPENPGGLSIPNRDKVVYERTEVVAPAPVVENLFPEPEQPMLPTTTIEPENKEEALIQPTSEMAILDEQVFPSSEPMPSDLPIEQATQTAMTEDTEKPTEQPAEEPVLPKAVTTHQVVWRAQLLSSADKKKVETSWKEISKQQAALLSDMPYQIVSATIAGKGTFWRLQVGEFATKEMAANLCTKLKKKKQDCIPVK